MSLFTSFSITPELGAVLTEDIVSRQPAIVLECGSGASTVVMGQACRLADSGHVWALENDIRFARATRARLIEHGLERWATVIDAPWDGRWYGVELELPGLVNLLLVDGPAGSLGRGLALPKLHGQLAADVVVYVDDTDRPVEAAMVERWCQANAYLQREDLSLGRTVTRLRYATAP